MVRAVRFERGLDVEQRTLWIGHVWIDQEQESEFSSGHKMDKLKQEMKIQRKNKVKITSV